MAPTPPSALCQELSQGLGANNRERIELVSHLRMGHLSGPLTVKTTVGCVMRQHVWDERQGGPRGARGVNTAGAVS